MYQYIYINMYIWYESYTVSESTHQCDRGDGCVTVCGPDDCW